MSYLQVETTAKDEIIKIPIAVLKVGENRVSQSFLEFPDAPVTFKLIQGAGPVHIHGHHLLGDFDGADMDDIEEEGLGDEEVRSRKRFECFCPKGLKNLKRIFVGCYSHNKRFARM